MINKTKAIIYISIIVLTAILFFIAGRSSTESEYIQLPGKTITDTVYSERLVPYEITKPEKQKLPTKKDTLYLPGDSIPYLVYENVDTSKIISNYIELKKYKKEMFNNDDGVLVVDAEVQYNELSKLGYTFTPIEHKVVLNRTITPFVNVSYNSFGFVEAGGGIYFNNFGIDAKYITNLKDKGFEVGINYKF